MWDGRAHRIAARHLCRAHAKCAWLPLPDDDPYFFGYHGEGADVAARRMNAAIRAAVAETTQKATEVWLRITQALVEAGGLKTHSVERVVSDAVQEMRTYARDSWDELRQVLLLHASVDLKPGESRTAASEPLRQLYGQLADKVDGYTSLPLRQLYHQLAKLVDQFFRTVR